MNIEQNTLNVVETRKLGTFRIVSAIESIEGADAIELAVVGGWKVVTKKNEFKVGDNCIYLECDSFLPDGVPAWQFLVDKSPKVMGSVRGHKLRTIKLRGRISQGLILKVTDHPATKLVLALDDAAFDVCAEACTAEQIEEAKSLRYSMDEHFVDPRELSLNKLLGIVKFEPPMSIQLAGLAAGLFPSFIRKTDQERAQNLKAEIFGFDELVIPANEEFNRPQIIKPARADRDALYEVSMKLDGSSMTVFARSVYDEPFKDENGDLQNPIQSGVCSRNLELKVNDDNAGNTFVGMALKSGLLNALTKLAENGSSFAVQGELMGPGIQGNREQLKDFEMFVFDIFNIRTSTYLAPAEREKVFKTLIDMGVKIKHVPILNREANLLQTLNLVDMDALLNFAEGPSIKHPIREGLVYKRLDGQFSFKTIANGFLVREKE